MFCALRGTPENEKRMRRKVEFLTKARDMSLEEKLNILTDAAKYDVACTSSGVDRKGNGRGIGNCVAAEALVLGGFGALVVAFLLFVPRGVVRFRDFMGGIGEGVKSMVPADIILILAWTISGVCRDLLMTGEFVRDWCSYGDVTMSS